MSRDPAVRDVKHVSDELTSLAISLVGALDGAVRATVATVVEELLTVTVSTDPDVTGLDVVGEGPTLEAQRLHRIVRIPSTQRSQEWPELCAELVRERIFSVGAFPIKRAAGAVVGVLTVSSADHHGFGAADIRACRETAEHMAGLLDA